LVERAQALAEGVAGLPQQGGKVVGDAVQAAASGADHAERPQGQQGDKDGGDAVHVAGPLLFAVVEFGFASQGLTPGRLGCGQQPKQSGGTGLALLVSGQRNRKSGRGVTPSRETYP